MVSEDALTLAGGRAQFASWLDAISDRAQVHTEQMLELLPGIVQPRFYSLGFPSLII
jgi:hypothetical protein